jgi:hypothetical protein
MRKPAKKESDQMRASSHYSKQAEVSIELRLGLPMNKKKLEHLEARRNLFQKNDPDTANNLLIFFSANTHQYTGSVSKRN